LRTHPSTQIPRISQPWQVSGQGNYPNGVVIVISSKLKVELVSEPERSK
jgi:hypothetical protein